MTFSVGILIASDKASQEKTLDKTTGAIAEYFDKYNQLDNHSGAARQYEVTRTLIVADKKQEIQEVVQKWCSASDKVDLLLTSGGTGFTDHDSTPEAIKELLDREAPGIVHAMLSESLKITPFAMMARPVAGTKAQTLIVTLPGSPKGAIENLNAIVPTLAHALAQIGSKDSRALHKKMQRTLQNAPPGNGDTLGKLPGVDPNVQYGKDGHEHGNDLSHHGHNSSHAKNQDSRNNCGIARHTLISNDLNAPVTTRARSSPYPMVSMDEAYAKINSHTCRPVVVSIDIRKTDPVGYILAQDIVSPCNVPEFRASIVDGYAVKSSDGPGVYPVTSISHASPSESQHQLQHGEIARITTGAPIPLGADAIVMVEETQLVSTKNNGTEELEVRILAQGVQPNDNVREKGSDIAAGELVFNKGTEITASGGEVGILASMGICEVQVYRKPVVGVLSTGDELVDTVKGGSKPLVYGQIFDSNRPTLLSAVENSHFQLVDLQIASDSQKSLETVIQEAFDTHDLDYLVTTGGVSMGEMDLLKPIIERSLHGTIHFGRVKMKPGKPTTFATFESRSKTRAVFALPGNPSSAAVTFYLFVLPSLRKFSGVPGDSLPKLPVLKAKLKQDAKLDPRPEYQRVHLYQDASGQLWAQNTGFQRSSRIASFRHANGLVALKSRDEANGGVLRLEEEVEVLLFGTIGGWR